MIDIDVFMNSCKAYQEIIDRVTLDECVCVAMGIPINCNHEEMIVRAIIQRLLETEQYTEPKKVLYRRQRYGTPYLCPNCEADQTPIEFFHDDGTDPKEKHSWCWHCGQKLDWNIEKTE